MKKLLSLVLLLALVLSAAGCAAGQTGSLPEEDAAGSGGETVAGAEATEYADPYGDLAEDYDAQSAAIYDAVLGAFYQRYETARAETENMDQRYAEMALAEAKLLEAGVFLPLTAQGGNYGISRVAPYTASSILWGADSKRVHNLVVTTEPITAEDRESLKALWASQKGTGTWEETCVQWLTDHGYTCQETYTRSYNADPQTWDILTSARSVDIEALVNTYDGLVEYDAENVLQPALAERWTVSEDGLTYTFYLRQGVKWVDSQGREVAEVTADDFVAGMQHMLDGMGGMEYLVQGLIVNASEYLTGEVTDFSEVGVQAVDPYTVSYTLCQPTPYFMTMLSHSVFAPMNRAYFESKGGGFGSDFDNTAADYTYGKTPDDIAYCGPYLVSNATASNTIVFTANPAYWNRDKVRISTVTWLYHDMEDALKPYRDTMAGVLDECSLTASAVEAAEADGVFDTLAYVIPTDSTAFTAFMNVNRHALANFNDPNMVVSPKSEEELLRSRAAMYLQSFRLAVLLSLDRAAYNAQGVGETLKNTSLINTFTPGTFVSLAQETTVECNGTAVTFPAGTSYGAMVQAQLDADGVPIQVWDPEADGGIGASSGFDGWYNPDAAAAYLQEAVAELAAQGIEVTAERPIYLDLPYFSGSETYSNRANTFKQSVETVLGGLVRINLVECVNSDAWSYAGYFCSTGAECNYDIYDVSGWSADYGDPQCYLDAMLPDYAGYLAKSIGLF